MNNSNPTNTKDWLTRLKSEVNRDKKKTIFLITLLIIAGILGGRALVRYQPNKANASSTDDNNASKSLLPDSTLHQAILDSSSPEEKMPQLTTTHKRITRDLFKPDPRYFPMIKNSNCKVVLLPKQSKGIFDQVHSWVQQTYSRERERYLKIEAIRNQAESLSLQSTMVGPSPSALINGRVVRIGETIEGFKVVSIKPNTCVISKDGIELELHMKQ